MAAAAASVSKKTAVVTGASSGIGAALAELLAKQGGYRVGLIARREEQLKEVVAKCGPGATYACADITKPEEVAAAFAKIRSEFGVEGFSLLVNNAGRGCNRLPSAMSVADLDDMMAVNVHSVVHCTKEVLPFMMQRNAGIILNVSSVLGRTCAPRAAARSAYVVAKHALNGWTISLRAEMSTAAPNVRIATASPGPVATDFGLNAQSVDSRLNPDAQSVESCAAAILEQIATLEGPGFATALESYTDKSWYSTILAQYGRWGAF